MLRYLRRRTSPNAVLLSLIVVACLLFIIIHNQYQIRNTLSYATRPLWDADDSPKWLVAHYYAEGMRMDAHACELHEWNERAQGSVLRVLDAVLMSSELDLLEIRMEELDAVVDHFLIVESNATFTGLPKATYFADHRDRFARFESKIVYRFLPGFSLEPGETAWTIEARTRDTMTALLQDQIRKFPPGTSTVVLMSDVDEIPARHTVALLRACDFGSAIHLQLRNFLYSFEWYIGLSSWRASATLWGPTSYYRHSKATERILADAGWHCSFCFRTIPEYVVKMRGFSHSDRIGGRIDLLDPKRIQATICSGKDIFGMLPEAYSYVDLFSHLSLEPSKSAVGLPRFLIDNAERLQFLLPGGCIREE